jgi:hypothetical protein
MVTAYCILTTPMPRAIFMLTFVNIKFTVNAFKSWPTGTCIRPNKIGAISILTRVTKTLVCLILAQSSFKTIGTVAQEIIYKVYTGGIVLTRNVLAVVDVYSAVFSGITIGTVTFKGTIHIDTCGVILAWIILTFINVFITCRRSPTRLTVTYIATWSIRTVTM